MPVLRHAEGAGDSVALSVDDGPMPDSTPQLLALMRQHGAQATFFVSGIRASRAPALVRAMVEEGHEVFGHGWEHIRLDRAGIDRLRQDVEKAEALLSTLRPTPSPYIIRLPYAGGYRDRRVHRALRRWRPDCQMAHWRLSLEDHTILPRCHAADEVRRECRAAVERLMADPRLPGSILLCHDQPFDVEGERKAEVTVTVMEELLGALSRRGLKAVSIRPRPRQSLLSRFLLV